MEFGRKITGCYNTGTISGNGDFVGGVCGYSKSPAAITRCYNTGTVNGSLYAGGVCGLNESNGTITGCYNTGKVNGSFYVGGVCGDNNGGAITGCYNIGTVDGRMYAGGVCGLNESNGTITGCYTIDDEYTENKFKDGTVCGLLNAALINANSDVRFYQGANLPELFVSVGGVYQIGSAEELYLFAELVNNGNTDKNTKAVLTADIVVNTGVLKADGTLADDTSGFTSWTPIGNYDNKYTGKFDGQGHTISGLYFNDSSTDFVGLFGYLGTDGEIKNVGVIDSYFSGYDYVGSLCGTNGGIITGCYSTGTITCHSYVGGVCGWNSGTIAGCYNIGTVGGTNYYIGGVCGTNAGTTIGCYSTGTVSGSSYVGGVCGLKYGSSCSITDCYTNRKGDTYYISDTKFANGTVCKLLNTALQNENSDVRFCQRIGTNISPLLVYQVEEHTPIYTVENNTFNLACPCGKITTKTMELTLTTEKTVVANGEENTLTATLSNYDNETVTYTWYQNDTLIENATSSTYKMPTNLSLGTYTYKVDVTMADAGTITQSVSVFVDNDPPTGEISVGTKSWTESPDNITFDSFFKDTQTVTITASDNSGKAVKIEYLVSHKELTAEELANATFTAYSDTFSIDPDNEYVIYAKLTDESGNVAYISSNGIVLDSVVPVISGIENGKTYCEEQTFTVTENYIKSVTVNGTEVTLDENNQFTLNPAEGTQEIVVTDKAGNVSDEMIVTVNDGHTDENPKDHKCDICGENVGVHDDINKDHKCDYGCDEEIGEHKVADGKHTCDYCGKEMTTCKDENPKDHKCDICGENVGVHEDINKDHKCDYGCDEPIGEHKVADGKHTCDYCGKEMTTCKDENPIDHKCDICGATLTEHSGGTATCTDKATCDICDEPYGELDSNNHNLENIPAKDATVTEEGNIEYWHCVDCGKYFSDKDGKNTIELKDTVIAKLPPEKSHKKEQSVSNVTNTITKTNTDNGDVKGSKFAPLKVTATSSKKKTVTLTWSKVSGAKGYIVYGAMCGKTMKKIKTTTGKSYTVKNLKNGKYYKYMVVAYKTVDGKQVVSSISKVAHVAVKGGKYGNVTKITVNKIKPVKQGKKLTLKATVKYSKKNVKTHVPIRYESTNTKIAKVSSKGVITAKAKGVCYIYVYAQNGVYKKVKVTVK